MIGASKNLAVRGFNPVNTVCNARNRFSASKWLKPIHTCSTAQLQRNVCTFPKCIVHVSQMCPPRIPDASHIWLKRAGQLIRSLLKLYCEVGHVLLMFRMHLACVLDTSRTCSGHILHAFQMHVNVTLELGFTGCTI